MDAADTEAPPTRLGARHRQPGNGAMGGPQPLHLRRLPHSAGRGREPLRPLPEYAAADGWEPGPEKFAFMVCCHVNETEEKAQEAGKAFLWRMNYPLRGPREYWSPPGYASRAGAAAVASRRPVPF